MKKLVSPGTVVIPSGYPRTRRRDSRGVRICFAGLARSCADMEGFFEFTDGSNYAYTPVSNGLAEVLCASSQRGRFFNLSIRRAVFGYTRGFTPPADFETIYSFPPYLGTAPAQCSMAMLDWSMLVWDTYVPFGFPPSTVTGSAAGASFNFALLSPVPPGNNAGFQPVHASLLYTGPTQNAQLAFTLSTLVGPNEQIDIVVAQDGALVARIQDAPGSVGTTVYPFTIAAGVNSLIEIWDAGTYLGGNPFVSTDVGAITTGGTGFGVFSNV